ncbi:MAG: serine/threonine protein kinase, partial [Holophagales bacterium]|nr:serine/threonine protein kinase [Holophagales bacterium]
MIGETVASYEVVEELGRGGMGIVYRAHDRRLRRDVALKVLHPERVSDAKRQRRFVREARTASALAHPGIVTVFDIVQHEGAYALVMELVPGVPLRQLLRGGHLPWRRALGLAVQLAEAVHAAHREGIVHRDLKPENVMVASGDRVKVLDFGIAKLSPLVSPTDDDSPGDDGETVLSSLSHDRELGAGTLVYMAPEQALAEKMDERTDVFAFGILLYEMLVGQPPFRGSSPISTIRALLYEQPEPIVRLRP